MAKQTNHRAGSDLHPFIARLIYDQLLTSDKTGNANRRPVKWLICSGDVSDILWSVGMNT